MPRPVGVPGVLRDRPLIAGVAISALLSVAYLVWQPQTLDLAAQTYRADLWSADGFVIWSPDWYGGFTVPGYSLLYPPLGALFGPELLGALCAVAAAALFGAIALRAFGERAWPGIVWFGVASTVALYGGRITFALGLALGLATILAIQRDRRVLAAAGGVATAAASPVAGLFALLAAAAVIITALWRRRAQATGAAVRELPVLAALAAALGAGLALAALAIAFPTDGYQPFVFSAFVPIPLAVAAIWLLSPPGQDLLRIGALLYLLLGLTALLVESPLGGNAVRLGVTFAGPLAVIFLIRRRPIVLALVAIPLLYWQWTATVRDVVAAAGDPSTEAAFYEPLLSELADRGVGADDRVHVVATRNRWESVHVAERIPIDGGWLRQLETGGDYAFSGDSADEYLRRLRERGVSYLAVSDAEADHSAEDELALLGSAAFPLRPVFSGEHWRLYEIAADRDPLVTSAGGEVDSLGSDGFVVELGEGGVADMALRYSPYLEVTGGPGCIEEHGKGIRISGAPGASYPVEASLGPDGLFGRERSCSD